MKTKPLESYPRATFWTRITGHAIDFSIVGLAVNYIPAAGALKFIAAFVWVYYLVSDIMMKRTPGKMIMGLHYTYAKGAAIPRNTLIIRGFLRLLGPFLILSWRKCSILDLLTGIRVVNQPGIQAVVKSRRTRAPVR